MSEWTKEPDVSVSEDKSACHQADRNAIPIGACLSTSGAAHPALSAHTQEPWLAHGWSGSAGCREPIDTTLLRVDYERARACVNALAGIPDPAVAIEAARAALRLIGRYDIEDEHLLSEVRAALALLEGKKP